MSSAPSDSSISCSKYVNKSVELHVNMLSADMGLAGIPMKSGTPDLNFCIWIE